MKLLPVARRVLPAAALGFLIALPAAAITVAKGTPYFTVEISPPQPVAGEDLVVTVWTWEDVAHTVPARSPADTLLEGVLVLRSAAGTSPDMVVPLRHRALNEFRAIVGVPTAGDWNLVAFPDRTGWSQPEVPPGYPDSIALTVRTRDEDASANAAAVGLAALGLIVGALATLAVRGRRQGRASLVRASR